MLRIGGRPFGYPQSMPSRRGRLGERLARCSVAAAVLGSVACGLTPVAVGLVAGGPSAAASGLPSAPQARASLPPSSAYVLVDVQTGNVIAGYHEHLRLPPASLTKVLTALIAVGFLPPDARVPGTVQSLHAYPNIVGIEKGVGWPLSEVLQSMLVFSANDAAYAIAQRVSGDLDAFGPVMDRAARQIGMSDSPVFHDPAGLDGSEGVAGGNLVSARDLAIAGRDFLSVPELARIVKEQSYDFVDPAGKPHDLPSMNYVFLESYIGAIGIKTGFTDRAGACIMAAATRNGRTMLAVVLNGYNTTESAIDLLNEGFATPVADEKATDRLPPLALPTPLPTAPRQTPGQRRPEGPPSSAAPGSGRSAPGGKGLSVVPVTAVRTKTRLRGRASAGATGGRASTGGLTSVLSSWPARALLVLAAIGALLALAELAVANRSLRRRQRPEGGAVMLSFAGNRKRRQQLIDSYRRHERPNAFDHASAPGRR